MKIGEAIPILKAEVLLKRTPSGRPINEEMLENLKITIKDVNNQNSDIIICKNCRIYMSSLLASSGCQNCGLKLGD
jgi:hypothetical protein